VLRRLGWSTAVLGVVAALLLSAGFLWFIWRVPVDEIALDRNADGIVALTGGASRIADAIELLASGRGKRLLISGAYRATIPPKYQRLNPEYSLGAAASTSPLLNTLGSNRDQALATAASAR
jgi:hypothetical protein